MAWHVVKDVLQNRMVYLTQHLFMPLLQETCDSALWTIVSLALSHLSWIFMCINLAEDPELNITILNDAEWISYSYTKEFAWFSLRFSLNTIALPCTFFGVYFSLLILSLKPYSNVAEKSHFLFFNIKFKLPSIVINPHFDQNSIQKILIIHLF